jgi:hypothetical protein
MPGRAQPGPRAELVARRERRVGLGEQPSPGRRQQLVQLPGQLGQAAAARGGTFSVDGRAQL